MVTSPIHSIRNVTSANSGISGVAKSKSRSHDPSMQFIDPASIGIDVNALPEKYRSLFENIPELQYRDTRSGLAKLGDALGITSYFDTMRGQAEQDARNTYFQLLSLAREEDKNSEVSKIQQMRLAGENPDLVGTSGVSEASEFSEPESHLQFGDSAFQDLAQFGSMFLGAFGDAIGISSAIKGLESQGLDNSVKAMNLANSAYGVAENLWKNLPQSTVDSFFEDGWNGNSGRLHIFNISDDELRDAGITRKSDQRAVRRAFQEISKSYRGQEILRNARKDSNKSRAEDLDFMSKWFSYDGNSDIDVKESMKQWNIFLHDIEQAQYQYQRDMAEFNSEYYSTPGLAYNKGASESAKAFNDLAFETVRRGDTDPKTGKISDNIKSEYSAQYYSNKFNKACNEARHKLIQQLLNNGDMFSLILANQLITSSPLDSVGKIASSFGAFPK